MARPQPDESAEYYHRYIGLVPDGDVLQILRRQIEDTSTMLAGIGEERAAHRYAPDKWSIKQVVGHVADAERMFAFRAFNFARGDEHPLPSFEQDDYVTGADFDARSLRSLSDELRAVRSASLSLFDTFRPADLDREGTASGCRFTVRSLLYIIAGHELHHRAVLRERYL